MATVTVAHHPELTPERAMEVFQRHLAGKYDVYKMRAFGTRDFFVKESASMGVSVKLKQEANATTFVFTWGVPSPILRLLWVDVFTQLFRTGRREAMEEEVRSFIENASEFN